MLACWLVVMGVVTLCVFLQVSFSQSPPQSSHFIEELNQLLFLISLVDWDHGCCQTMWWGLGIRERLRTPK